MKLLGFEIKKAEKPVKPDPGTDQVLATEENTVELSQSDLHSLATKVVTDLAIKVQDELKNDSIALPGKGGRSSLPTEALGWGALMAEFATVMPDFPLQVYQVLENLATWNADVSYAVENIVQLGNTGFNIAFDENVPEEMQKKMRKYLKRRMKTWYNYSEGVNGLITDLLAQVAITGVLSSEIVPKDDLTGLKKIVLVHPKTIRFKYNGDLDEYEPYQVIKGFVSGKINQEQLAAGMIKLNTITYKYLALRRYGEKPYGIPPFLAAFENICIERDMMKSIKTVVKRLGVLGFLQVLLTAPKINPGEQPRDYEARVSNYMAGMLPEIEKGFANGIVLGFEGTHKFEVENTTTNVSGAKDLMEINTVMKMSGLKQDPVMLGRNFSTTETLARVLLAKLGTQVGNYQKKVAAFLESAIEIDLGLGGFPIEYAEVDFDKPMVGDKVREEQAYGSRIKNYNDLYNQGVISQVQRSQALGFDEPDEEEPRNQFTDSSGNPLDPRLAPKDDATGEGEDAVDPKTTAANVKVTPDVLQAVESALRGQGNTFEYFSELHCCEHDHEEGHVFSFDSNDQYENFSSKYRKVIKEQYEASVGKVVKDIVKGMEEIGAGATLEQVTDKVLYVLFKNWNIRFTSKLRKKAETWVNKAYKFFRDDKAVFGKYSGAIPEANLGLQDYRTMKYWADSDTFYLGRFITDEDTKKAVTDFIKKKYLEQQLPIGDKNELAAAFKEEFGETLLAEDWKISRIVNTTVNKMRNYAGVSYLEQAGIQRFVIQGVNDRLQCGYCSAMQGKSFSTTTAFSKIKEVSGGDEQSVKFTTPFITSIYKKPADMADLTAEQLQASGIDIPPYHPGCRDRVVADI